MAFESGRAESDSPIGDARLVAGAAADRQLIMCKQLRPESRSLEP